MSNFYLWYFTFCLGMSKFICKTADFFLFFFDENQDFYVEKQQFSYLRDPMESFVENI